MTLTPKIPDIVSAIASREQWAIETLGDWVRFASVLGHEAPAQEYIAGVYEELGFKSRIENINHDEIRKLPGYSPVDW